MKIEDLFKEKMSNANITAPENLWNKIENNLNNPPQSPNIDTNDENIEIKINATRTQNFHDEKLKKQALEMRRTKIRITEIELTTKTGKKYTEILAR